MNLCKLGMPNDSSRCSILAETLLSKVLDAWCVECNFATDSKSSVRILYSGL